VLPTAPGTLAAVVFLSLPYAIYALFSLALFACAVPVYSACHAA